MATISRKAFEAYRETLRKIRDHCSMEVGDAIDQLEWSTPAKIRVNKKRLVRVMEQVIGSHAGAYIEAVLQFGNATTSALAWTEVEAGVLKTMEAPPPVDTKALTSTVDYNAKKLTIGDFEGFKADICGHAAMYAKRVAYDQLGSSFAVSSNLTQRQRAARVRQGLEMAWVPSGDTCAFCIALASRGWQAARQERMGDYAEHVHGHCDCELVFRTDSSMEVEGYDPQAYRDIYYNEDILPPEYQGADSVPWRERVNAIRRNQYAQPEIGDRIREQHREQYAETHPHDDEGI